MLQREIKSTDQAIDALVYQLYGLTEAEIKNIEKKYLVRSEGVTPGEAGQ